MARTIRDLFREASQLSERERAELAGLLLETLDRDRDHEVEAQWSAEIERRLRQLEAGEVRTIPWEQVRAEMLTLLDEKR